MKTFPIALEDELHEKIQRIAFESKKSMKQFVIEAIKEKIDRERV